METKTNDTNYFKIRSSIDQIFSLLSSKECDYDNRSKAKQLILDTLNKKYKEMCFLDEKLLIQTVKLLQGRLDQENFTKARTYVSIIKDRLYAEQVIRNKYSKNNEAPKTEDTHPAIKEAYNEKYISNENIEGYQDTPWHNKLMYAWQCGAMKYDELIRTFNKYRNLKEVGNLHADIQPEEWKEKNPDWNEPDQNSPRYIAFRKKVYNLYDIEHDSLDTMINKLSCDFFRFVSYKEINKAIDDEEKAIEEAQKTWFSPISKPWENYKQYNDSYKFERTGEVKYITIPESLLIRLLDFSFFYHKHNSNEWNRAKNEINKFLDENPKTFLAKDLYHLLDLLSGEQDSYKWEAAKKYIKCKEVKDKIEDWEKIETYQYLIDQTQKLQNLHDKCSDPNRKQNLLKTIQILKNNTSNFSEFMKERKSVKTR